MKHRFQSGQSLAEYGLILTLVSVVAIGGLTTLGDSISNQLTDISSAFSNAGNAGNTGGGNMGGNQSTPGGNDTIAVGMTPSGQNTQTDTTANTANTDPAPAQTSTTTDSGANASTDTSQIASNTPTTPPASDTSTPSQGQTTSGPTPNQPVTSQPSTAPSYDANGNAIMGCTGGASACATGNTSYGW